MGPGIGSRLLQAAVVVLVGMLLMYIGFPLFDLLGASLMAPNEAKIYYSTGYDDNSCAIFSDNQAYQTFTTTDAFAFTHAKLRLYRVGNPGTVTMYVETTVAGVPSGTVVATTTVAGITLSLNTAGTWITFDPTDYDLVAATQYAIVLTCTGSSTNYIVWLVDESAPAYIGGVFGLSDDGGATWVAGNTC